VSLDGQTERRRKIKAREVPVELFSGEGATSIEAYLAQFQVAARRNGWFEDEWGEELALRLRGEARNLILPEMTSRPPAFDVSAAKLIQRFGHAEAPSIHVSAIRGKRKGAKETVPQLVQWFQSTGLKAFPTETEATRNRILVDYFIRAFLERNQREYMWDKDPTDLAAAAAAALRFEGIKKTEEQWTE
jgi:hypothetical protein